MTDELPPGAAPAPEPQPLPPPRRRRIWPWVLGLLGAALLVLALLPTLLGRLGAQAGLSAERVGGPLWAPTLDGARLQLPGVQAQAGRVEAQVAGVNPLTKTLRLNVRVADVAVALRLKDLVGGAGRQTPPGWRVVLNRLDVQRTRLTVDGSGVNVPDGQFTLSQDRGRLQVRGATRDGDLNAAVTLGEGRGGNTATIDLDADARVLNHYWPGVTAGRIAGRYVLGGGPVRGDLRLTGGALTVPQTRLVKVTDITGRAVHRGDVVELQLAGRGWNGPVTAQGRVDTAAKNWRVTADATPTVAGLAQALGTTGQGTLRLRVSAGGWSTVRVKAYAQGAGQLAGVTFRDANAEYTYLNEDGRTAGQTNDLAFSAQTAVGGADQRVAGRWAIGREGRVTVAGVLGQKPLDLTARIDAQNVVRVQGQGLGGPLSATFTPKGQQLQARLNPTYGAARARIALSGTPQNLRAVVTDGLAGPFALAGTAVLDRQGLRADLGRAQLRLNRRFQGSWALEGLQGAGLTLTGRGRLDLTGGDVSGTLTAAVPGLREPLSGPLNLNYIEQRGSFVAGRQVLGWQGDSFRVQARNLALAGDLRATGDVTLTTTLKAFGSLRVRGRGLDLSAFGRGTAASVRGEVGGVTLLADTALQAPYRTAVRVQGTDLRGTLNLQGSGALAFDLRSGRETARGLVQGDNVTATGRVDLTALRPLARVPDLGGTLDLNLRGQGGVAVVNARAQGATLQGTLTRRAGNVQANLLALYSGARARLSGPVFPAVAVTGRLSAQGQTLTVAVQGPYTALRAQATGRTGELSFGGVTVPAQAVNLRGTLTPRLQAAGRWGDLNVAYDGGSGLTRVSGTQALTAFGQTGRVQGQASWGLGRGGAFRGAVSARGVLDQYAVTLRGPWNGLQVLVTDGEGLRAQGTASLPSGRYNVDVSGPLGGGLFVNGNVQGTGLSPRGQVVVTDAAGGRARVTLRGFDNLGVQAQGLTLGGQRLQGTLQARDGVLSGRLQAGPFTLQAAGGGVQVSGTLADHTLQASGRLTLPATLSNLRLNVTGPYLAAQATGGVANLRGTVTLKPQSVGSGPTRLSLPGQTLPFSGSLTGARLRVGGLTYASGRWSGAVGVRYALGGRPGTAQLLGRGPALLAAPRGPVSGEVTLLPALGGQLSTALAPFTAPLPEAVRRELVPGQLVATLSPGGARLALQGARYLGGPLALNAQVGWTGGLRAAGTLTHPGSRLPLRYEGGTLSVPGASLDARVLAPVLPGAQGRLSLNLTVPGGRLERAAGQATVNVRAAGQGAGGRLTLRGGQLSADLRSTLAGRALRLRGPLYPQANAVLTLDDLRATLNGRAGPRASDTLTLRVGGRLEGRAVDLTVAAAGLTGPGARVNAGGTLAGAALNLGAAKGPGEGLAAWRLSGGASAGDLRPLAGVPGRLSLSLGGTLTGVRAQATGEVSGVAFSAPLSLTGGVLRTQGAQATLGPAAPVQGTARLGGALFPTLALSTKVTLTSGLPGQYTGQLRGSLQKPDVRLSGTLRGDLSGLRAAGTRLSARLLGADYRLTLTGPALQGEVRGRLGSGALGGLQRAALTLNAAYVAPQTDLRLRGPLGWNARSGFTGSLRVVGDTPGGPLDALLDGQGELRATAVYGAGAGQARLTGRFQASLPLRPGGSADLAAFDVGALWGRPGQLRATGQATLGGPSWSALAAAFSGRLTDEGGDLGGELRADWRGGDLRAALQGPRVQAQATLVAGRYALKLQAPGPLRVARLLPPGLDVDALTLGGTLDAQGTLRGGLEALNAQNLSLKGVQGEVGPFSLYGRARYQPGQEALSADLSGSLRDGLVTVRGALPGGLSVNVRQLSTDFVGAASLGRGRLSAALTLTGAARNPAVAGSVTVDTDRLGAQATVAGRLRSAVLNARLSPRGDLGGTLYAEARDLDLAAGRVRARLYGTLTRGEARAEVNLNGVWPALSGTVRARVPGLPDPVILRGDGQGPDGQGQYTLSAGALGGGTFRLGRAAGFVPTLSGALTLTPLPLVDGQGELSARLSLGGTLVAPSVAGTVTSRGAQALGVALEDLSGTLTAAGPDLRAALSQGGRPVLTLSGQTVTLDRLQARAAGSTLRVSGEAKLSGEAALTVDAAGTLAGRLNAVWRAQALTVSGALTGPQGLRLSPDLRADRLTGWHGTARLTGGPAGVLTRPALVTVGGAFDRPLVQGEAGLLGAGVRVVADARGVQLRFVDGPGAQASGVLEARPQGNGPWALLGAASLTRPELSLSLTPGGTVTAPQAQLSVRRGEWRAGGTASLQAADLSVSDGERTGTVRWNGTDLEANLPGLNLGRLGVRDLGGTVTAAGRLNPAAGNGRLTLTVADLSTPYTLPYVDLPLDGRLNADLTLQGGRPAVQAALALSSGTLNLQAAQGPTTWTGTLTGRVAREGGTLDVNLRADAAGVQGRIEAARLPVALAGQQLALSGSAALAGQTFRADLIGRATAAQVPAQVIVTASGGLADLVPALAGPLALAPTGEGYALRATLDDLALGDVVPSAALRGRVSGEATLRDGGGTFVLRSDDLTVGPRRLPARLEGTQVAGDWRIRGFLGESDFTAGLSGGDVFGQGTLRALPVGAVLGAATGTVPGEGVVTGVARFRFPLADPLAGRVNVVAERIRVSATSGEGASAVTETLTGSGTLDYAARELRGINVQLSGAGTWDVRGGYTRERVDLTARFTNTTFTPVLRLIPGLANMEPSLKGSVTLSAGGTYDRPRGTLEARTLAGTLAGLSVQIPDFSGELPDSGAFRASGQVLTGGTVGADGVVNLSGQLTLGRLSGTNLTFRGLLAPQALGALPNAAVTVQQQPNDRWTVTASSASTGPAGPGSLTLGGELSPRVDLTLSARNYNLPLNAIYGRESVLNADLRAADDGSVIRVQGAADFTRLVLGRVNAPATIPAPGQSRAGEGGRATDNYASPLPPEYTTFPRPVQAQEAPAPRALPFLERVVFEDIPIRAVNGIRVDENLVRAEFTGGLVLSGSGDRPRLSGEIRSQRGFIYLRENEFTLGDSAVTFTGDSVYPKFNITASGTVTGRTVRGDTPVTQRVPITLTLAGEFVTRAGGEVALDLDTTLACTQVGGDCADPTTGVPYGEAELYALVATGVPNLATLPNNLAALGSSALQTALNVFVLGELERTVAQAFGLDVFRFTPQLLGDSLGATITLGSYLTRNLYLQYQVDLTGQGLLNAEYSTPDGRLTFKVTTPLRGLNLQSIRPSFSAGYNVNPRTNISLGVQTTEQSTRLRFGVTYRIGGR
ncbi:translocation/assembly module TamB domain-containing protein [Deinococcus multiflagellatus]|uniref:translocation/assembly module TamB domain-containing protein n=1 Tax=Deinococcus multiflagellatus TaxID=1656887 RepID=UPI001CCD7A4D|nr:translocation/assembly module TamB domain-containing protein [Deinococcus multiflagellatus]MBZ9713668.1 translocation/assembly module TamB domain-containing protein [Deinococcus multiflagellatus]